ncbi:MAG: O-antigen ligase family protein [Pseudomonadota bacterium]
MPTSLYAAGLISVCAVIAFGVLRFVLKETIDPRRIERLGLVAIVTTCSTFLVPNYWLALLVACVAVFVVTMREPFKVAAFIVAVFSMPATSKLVPGFAGINYFLALSPAMAMSVVLLTPSLLPNRQPLAGKSFTKATDLTYWVLFVIVSVLAFRDVSVTAGLREITVFLLTSAFVYAAFSRVDWTKENLILLSSAFVGQFVMMSLVALHETVIGWHHYYFALTNWDIDFIRRVEVRSGLSRTVGTSFGSIAFGAGFMVAMTFALALRAYIKPKVAATGGFLAMLAGMVTTVSRGALISMVVSIVAFVGTGKAAFKRLAVTGIAGVFGMAVISLTPLGRDLLNILPFMSNDEDVTLNYRAQLLEVGSGVVMKNPLFGSVGYMDDPDMEVLRQGQGIIDIVNSYLHFALDYGLIGLTLYLIILSSALWGGWRSISRIRVIDGEMAVFAQAVFAATLSLAVLFASTTMRTGQFEVMNWALIGMCVGLARKSRLMSVKSASAIATAPASEKALHNSTGLEDADNEKAGAGTKTRRPTLTRSESERVPAHLRQYLKTMQS